jgi:hypothetical protein
LPALIVELRHYRCNITAIQETKWKGNHQFQQNTFTVLLSNGTALHCMVSKLRKTLLMAVQI